MKRAHGQSVAINNIATPSEVFRYLKMIEQEPKRLAELLFYQYIHIFCVASLRVQL
jgi:hypothetical protein